MYQLNEHSIYSFRHSHPRYLSPLGDRAKLPRVVLALELLVPNASTGVTLPSLPLFTPGLLAVLAAPLGDPLAELVARSWGNEPEDRGRAPCVRGAGVAETEVRERSRVEEVVDGSSSS